MVKIADKSKTEANSYQLQAKHILTEKIKDFRIRKDRCLKFGMNRPVDYEIKPNAKMVKVLNQIIYEIDVINPLLKEQLNSSIDKNVRVITYNRFY